jgi:hypothetical protein
VPISASEIDVKNSSACKYAPRANVKSGALSWKFLLTFILAIVLAGCGQSDRTIPGVVSDAPNRSNIPSSGDASAAARFEGPPPTAAGTVSETQEGLQATQVNRVAATYFDDRYTVAVEARTRSAPSMVNGVRGSLIDLSPGDSFGFP